MTSPGPDPQWLLDPDDHQLERYWNGVGWTEYRRLIRPGGDGPPAVEKPQDVDASRVPWVANASYAAPVADAPEASDATALDGPVAGEGTVAVPAPDVATTPGSVRPPGWRNVSPGYERWWDGTTFVGPVRSFRPRGEGPRWLRRTRGER